MYNAGKNISSARARGEVEGGKEPRETRTNQWVAKGGKRVLYLAGYRGTVAEHCFNAGEGERGADSAKAGRCTCAFNEQTFRQINFANQRADS